LNILLCQVASDESDFEADDKPKDENVVTLKMVKHLEEKLHNSRYHGLIRFSEQLYPSPCICCKSRRLFSFDERK
jgi:hypothetical protein